MKALAIFEFARIASLPEPIVIKRSTGDVFLADIAIKHMRRSVQFILGYSVFMEPTVSSWPRTSSGFRLHRLPHRTQPSYSTQEVLSQYSTVFPRRQHLGIDKSGIAYQWNTN